MLTIKIPILAEGWDETREEFVDSVEQTIELEHSLLSLAKWESKWCKSFIEAQDKTAEETLDYIKCMTVTPNVHPDVYHLLTKENVDAINEYINAPMTATTFRKTAGGRRSNEIITSEIIYHWMTALNIPFECENWHLNKLITLIRVSSIKNQPPKKMSGSEIMRRNDALNEMRMQQSKMKG
jgi:hypothetical protein